MQNDELRLSEILMGKKKRSKLGPTLIGSTLKDDFQFRKCGAMKISLVYLVSNSNRRDAERNLLRMYKQPEQPKRRGTSQDLSGRKMNFTETLLETLEKLPGVKGLQALAAEYYRERLFREVKARGNLPHHVAIIVEDSGQEEKINNLGGKKLEEVLEWCLELEIEHITMFALPMEVFERPARELGARMDLFK